MSDTSAAVPAVPAPVPVPKRNWLVDDVEWVIAHSWSLRFVFLAFVFSALEVVLPLLTNLHGLPGYPLLIGLCTGCAFVARLVAQKRAGTDE